MSKHLSLSKTFSLAFTSTLALFLISCSETPDVRLGLCQDMVSIAHGNPKNIEFKEHQAIIKGYDDLEMLVNYVITSESGEAKADQASCYYPYEDDESNNAELPSDTTAPFSTYPVKVVIKSQAIEKQDLVTLINQVMVKQGKRAMDKAEENAILAREKIKQSAQNAEQKVKEGVEAIEKKAEEGIKNLKQELIKALEDKEPESTPTQK